MRTLAWTVRYAMPRLMRGVQAHLLATALILGSPPERSCSERVPICSQQRTDVRWGDFEEDWLDQWMERRLNARRTRYEVVQEDGGTVLRARSERSASALLHELNIPLAEAGRISWRWKVTRAVPNNIRERTKAGDDYAARVFVIFGEDPLGPQTEAICYVWAANEPVGSVYENPYVPGVATVVVEAGNERAGEWLAEGRDFVEDFRKIFGREPKMVSAVAVMVDTDNTGTRTTAWFDGISLELPDAGR